MIEERGGWFVVNVRDARWYGNPSFGKVGVLEDPSDRFPQTGIHVYVLEPGKPNCRYHREGAQEDFLVLSGRCRLIVNGEERDLRTWDFVHCPAGVTHVLVGDDDAPCAVLAIGHRPADHPLFYPSNEIAKRFGAEAPEPTSDPKVAYSDVAPRAPVDPPDWPPSD